MEIRPYTKADEKQVMHLWREVFPDAPSWNDPQLDIRRKAEAQGELFMVASERAEVIGTVMAGYDGHRGWVHYLAVSPEHRRRGVGAALMETAEAALAEMGCPKLNLQVRAGNEAVVAFYEKLGFHVEEPVSMGKRLESRAGSTDGDEKGDEEMYEEMEEAGYESERNL